MANRVIPISEAEGARDFAGMPARVREGTEVVIKSDARAVAVVRPASKEFRPACFPNPSHWRKSTPQR